MSHILTPPFHVIRRDGSVRLFHDLAQAWEFISLRPRDRVGLRFSEAVWPSDPANDLLRPLRLAAPHRAEPPPEQADVIVRDDLGFPVHPSRLYEAWRRETPRRPCFWERRAERIRRAAERGLPIPGTGVRPRGGWLRHPRHIGMDRANSALREDMAELEGDVPLRRLRRESEHSPPNAWDDIPRSHRGASWKLHRRTRWKA